MRMVKPKRRRGTGQAAAIVEACGGIDSVAAITGLNRTSVWRWMQPSRRGRRGGRDGWIPDEHHQTLLDWARKNGVALKPAMFVEPMPMQRAA